MAERHARCFNAVPLTQFGRPAVPKLVRMPSRKSLSQNSGLTQGDAGEVQMDERQMICGLLFPADQQSAGAVRPAVGSLDDPTASTLTAATCAVFFAARTHMRSIVKAANHLLHRFAIVPFVQAQMLRAPPSGARARCGDGGQSGREKFLIVNIRAIDHDGQRHAASVGEHRPLNAEFAAIRRVFAGFFPRRAATWPSTHQRFATATRCRTCHRIPAGRASIAARRRPLRPILENSDGPCLERRSTSAIPSTGNPFAAHTKSHPSRRARTPAGVRPFDSTCTWATTAPGDAIFFPATANTFQANHNAYNPPCEEKKPPSLCSTHEV